MTDPAGRSARGTALPEVEVAAALIRDQAGRYLIARRRRGVHLEGLWEFPGGKREAGESLAGCLGRELTEELGAVFTVEDEVAAVRFPYPEKVVAIHFFRCRLAGGVIEPREGQETAWVAPERLGDYAFPAADAALVARLVGGATPGDGAVSGGAA